MAACSNAREKGNFLQTHRKRVFTGAPPKSKLETKKQDKPAGWIKFQLTQSFGRLAFHDSRHKKNANGENTE
jgi:hypothetical protein